MMNVWSLGRFPSVGGSNVTSGLNSFGYFAYSTNQKVIIIDLNSMIDGNNGNLLLRSNTYNRIVIDFQKINTSISSWKEFKFNLISQINDIFNKISIKSIFVNDILWGPFMYYRWSLLLTCLNNGLVHVWLIPNIDSFSLSSYSPNPCFELIDSLYNSIKNEEDLFEFDWDRMEIAKFFISESFCLELMLNTDNPKIYSSVTSIQKTFFYEKNKNICFLLACWNEFMVIYKFELDDIENNEIVLKKIINQNQKELFDILPILPKVNCFPILLTRLPMKDANEIITSCSITDFWNINNDLFFELYIGTSMGKIFIFKHYVENKTFIKCENYKLIHRIYPSIPISFLIYEPFRKDNKKHIWSASNGKNLIIGKTFIENQLIKSEILRSNNSLNHQLPIKSIKFMSYIVFDESLYEISFFSIDQNGTGILNLVDIENNCYNSVKVLTMNKLSNSQSVFPNFDQNFTNINDEIDSPNKSLQLQNISFESLQNVPSSILSIKKNNSDYKLVSFVYSSIPGHFNFLRNDFQTFSVALIYSAKLNTIRLLLILNSFSPIDHICNRIKTHITQTELLINETCAKKNLFFSKKYSQIISNTFTLNDIRLVLAGPLTINKIPILEESSEKEPESSNNSLNKIYSNNEIKPSSFLNFKFGKALKSKINSNHKDLDSDNVLSIFSSLFYENIPVEVVNDSLAYNEIEDEFQFEEFNYKLIFSNMIILIICYIVEIEPFIPKCMGYLINFRDKNNVKLFIKSLLEFLNCRNNMKYISNNNSKQDEQNIYPLKLLYILRILNCLRCLVLILYSRSNDSIDVLTMKREEQIADYLIKLQYYLQIQLNNLNNNMTDINPNQNYIWNCIKNLQPICFSYSDQPYFQDLIENSYSLIAEKPFNKYKCFYNQELHNEVDNEANNFTPENSIYFVPVCPITFLPINIFEKLKHLSCNCCGRIVFLPLNFIKSKDLSLINCSSTSIFERYCLQNSYITCQICLNLTDLLEI